MDTSLDGLGQWGEAKLIHDLTHISCSPASDDEYHLLPLVVSAALGGADIARRYPGFHDRLLACPDLERAFLDALAALEPAGAPASPARTWRLTAGELQAIFFGPAPIFAFRGEEAWVEDTRLELLSAWTEVDGRQVYVKLSVLRPAETPGRVVPQAAVAIQPTPSDPDPGPPGLSLILACGGYQAAVRLDPHGQAVFPELDLGSIWDEAGQCFTSELTLTLQPDPA